MAEDIFRKHRPLRHTAEDIFREHCPHKHTAEDIFREHCPLRLMAEDIFREHRPLKHTAEDVVHKYWTLYVNSFQLTTKKNDITNNFNYCDSVDNKIATQQMNQSTTKI